MIWEVEEAILPVSLILISIHVTERWAAEFAFDQHKFLRLLKRHGMGWNLSLVAQRLIT